MNRIPLGVFVKDLVTGLIGVAENRCDYLHGCARYYVQPVLDKDGKIPDGFTIDEPQLKILDDRDPVMTPPGEPKILINLGQEVKDPISDQTGTAIGRSVYLNGCARICVQPKQKGHEQVKCWWADEAQLNPVKSFLGKEKSIEKPKPKKVTGGPAISCAKY